MHVRVTEKLPPPMLVGNYLFRRCNPKKEALFLSAFFSRRPYFVSDNYRLPKADSSPVHFVGAVILRNQTSYQHSRISCSPNTEYGTGFGVNPLISLATDKQIDP